MTDVVPKATYRTPSGGVLSDADIEGIAEEVETTDLDPARAKVLYPTKSRRVGHKAGIRSPREP